MNTVATGPGCVYCTYNYSNSNYYMLKIFVYKFPHMVEEVVRRVVDEEPEQAGNQDLRAVGEGGEERFAA